MDPSALIVPAHAIAASLVILLAPVNLLRRRRDRAHRVIGRSWVIAMYVTCVSGMFIYSMTGGFTFFHALAIFTFITTTLGVINIRRGKRRAHIGNMVGGWLGALVAGSFAAFGPTRDIPRLAVGDPVTFWSIVAALIVASTVWVWFVLVVIARPKLAKPTLRQAMGPAPQADSLTHRQAQEAAPHAVGSASREAQGSAAATPTSDNIHL
ncbi:MAG: DUF2306 domain-containing protein [Pseudoclavibacter sp.]